MLFRSHPPIKYLFSIYEEPTGDSPIKGTLLGMVVSANATDDETKHNGGYNMQTANSLKRKKSNLAQEMRNAGVTVPNGIPEILISSDSNENGFDIPVEFWPANQTEHSNAAICTPQTIQHDPDANGYVEPQQNIDCASQLSVKLSDKSNPKAIKQVANLNTKGWEKFCNESSANIGFARLFLLRLWSMSIQAFNPDLSFYQTEDEIIMYMDNDIGKYGVAKAILDKNPEANIFQYVNAVKNLPSADALSGVGHIKGPVGICNNREYKLRQIARSIGIWILVGVIVLIALIMFVPMLFSRKGQTAVPNTE